jgi:uncharacterized protein YjbI with pentapeptide repeats
METSKEISDLSERWEAIPGFRLRDVLLSPHESPFGRTADSLWDFRAVLVEGAIYQIEIVDVDLAHSNMGVTGQLGGGLRALRCRFDGCKYHSNVNGVFEGCSYRESNLADSTIGGTFLESDFTSANLSRVRGSQVIFTNCRFIGSIFVKACLYESEFVDCLFENVKFGRGSLAGSSFSGCEFAGVDWKDTILDHVSGID